jgi:MFS family permease
MDNITRYRRRALAGGYMGWMFDAVDFMVLSLAIPFIIIEWNLELSTAGLASTFTLFGAAFGAYIWGPLSDRFGRKPVLAICLVCFGLFTVACGFATTFTMLTVFRFISGLALGGEWVIGAALVAEYFPPEHRAKATSFIQSSWPIGYFIVLAASYWLVPIYGWRVLFYIGGLTLLGAAYIWFFVKESPVWLAVQAQKVQENKIKASEVVKEETGLKFLFNKENRKDTLLACLMCIFILVAYWGGGSWIPAYLSTEKGLSITKTISYLIVYNGMGLLGYAFYGWISDKFGRRWNFWIGGYGSAIAVIGFMTASTTLTGYIWGGIFGFLCLGYFGPMGTFLSEQFPTKVRGLGISVSYATGRLAAAAAPFVLGAIAMATSLQSAIMYLAIIYAGGAVVVHFMKETKGTVFETDLKEKAIEG